MTFNSLSYDTSDDLAAAKKMLETVERMIADDDPEAASQHCGTLAHAANDLHNAILRSWEDRDADPGDEAVARAADYRERMRAVQGELA